MSVKTDACLERLIFCPAKGWSFCLLFFLAALSWLPADTQNACIFFHLFRYRFPDEKTVNLIDLLVHVNISEFSG